MLRANAQPRLDWQQLRAALLTAAGAFFLSRCLVLLFALVPALLEPAAMEGPASDRVALALNLDEAGQHLSALAGANDAGWYKSVVRDGYERRRFTTERPANWAFFPLLPMVWRASIAVVGDNLWAALVPAHAALYAGLVALFLLCLETGRSVSTATRATYFAALAPSAYFFSFPWTESFFLCFCAVCLLAAYRRIWWLMALAGFAATATRFPGLFLLPAAFLICWQRDELHWRFFGACACMALGVLLFAIHLWNITGNPLAFADIQVTWGRSFEVPVRAIGILALRPWELAIDWNLRYLNLAAMAVGILATRHLIYRKELGLAAFLALGLLAALMTGTLTSLSRYTIALFPISMFLADWAATAQRERVWLIVSVALLSTMTIAFGFGLNFAAA